MHVLQLRGSNDECHGYSAASSLKEVQILGSRVYMAMAILSVPRLDVSLKQRAKEDLGIHTCITLIIKFIVVYLSSAQL